MITTGPQAQAQELLELFALLDTWQEKYHLIIDLGKQMPPLNDAEKVDENQVKGCQSTVWLLAQVKEQRLSFRAQSDSAIVSGLIAILKKLYADQPVEAVSGFDINGFMDQLGLSQHLSMSRRNGLSAMIQKLRALSVSAL